MRTAIFPGSFNPFTIGHEWIAERALELFDRLVIAVGYNESKGAPTDLDERLHSIQKVYEGNPRVEIIAYSDLTVDLARRTGARFIVRGLRNSLDFEYEKNMADINRKIGRIETVFLTPPPELSFISSSVARELSHHGYDISSFLPPENRSGI